MTTGNAIPPMGFGTFGRTGEAGVAALLVALEDRLPSSMGARMGLRAAKRRISARPVRPLRSGFAPRFRDADERVPDRKRHHCRFPAGGRHAKFCSFRAKLRYRSPLWRRLG